MLDHLLIGAIILAATAASPALPPTAGAPATAPSPAASSSPAGATSTSGAPSPSTGAAPPATPAHPARPAATPPAKRGSTHGAKEIPIARFSASDLSGWSDKSHKGKTSYTLEDGALKAHAVKAASGKIKKVSIDVKKYQKLRWSWKIDHTLKREDIKLKNGDDFAARVYVIFPRTFFWRMRAINYVWAAKMPKGSEAASPYIGNSIIVAVESGDDKAGKWVSEERNIYEDYKRIFGEEPPLLGGVAIMTDTDDTQDEATAWYGDITLLAP
jgi:hypothetical protein